MGMISCSECGNFISQEADVCPHCGKKVKKLKPMDSWVDVICMVTLAFSALLIAAGRFYVLYAVPLFWALVYLWVYEHYKDNYCFDISGVKQSLTAIVIAFLLPTFFIIIF
jgi:RNA polymerase subunit RPABC4/transcription elongation factor Spt4